MIEARKFNRFTCFALMLCFCSGLAAAQNVPRYGIFVYSNFCTSPMSGDLAGDRISLRRLIDGDTLIYEYTDGSTHAVIADKLELTPGSGALRFEVHAQNDLNSSVSGRLSGDGATLTLDGMLFHEGVTVTLKQIKDFAAPIHDCVEHSGGQKRSLAASFTKKLVAVTNSEPGSVPALDTGSSAARRRGKFDTQSDR